MKHKRKKVLLFQARERIPHSLQSKIKNHNCTSLPCGYIKTIAHSNGFLSEIDVDIFPVSLSDIAGDNLIVEKIKEYNPDILWLPYLCETNAERTLFLAQKAKEVLNNLYIIGNSSMLPLKNKIGTFFKTLDIGTTTRCDETTAFIFEALLDRIYPDKIPGVHYKGRSEFHYNKPSAGGPVMKNIPSPYSLGFCDAALEKDIVILETKRACPYKCRYCSSHSPAGKNSYLPLSRLKEELLFLKDKNVSTIYFGDPTFNLPRDRFAKVCNLLREINTDRKINFRLEVKADILTPQDIRLLAGCNIKQIEVGVQSLTKEVLKISNRPTNEKMLLENLKLLKKSGIFPHIHLIAGLPGETPETFVNTIDILTEEGYSSNIVFFPFILNPASSFALSANKMGLISQKTPPHLILKTPTMSFEELKSSIFYAIEKGARCVSDSLNYLPPVFSLLYYDENAKKNGIPRTKLIIDLDLPIFETVGFRDKLNYLKRNLACSVVVWFKSAMINKKIGVIREILLELSKDNPYNTWNIILEVSESLTQNVIDELKWAVSFRPNSLDYEAVYLADNADCEYFRISVKFYLLFKREFLNNKYYNKLKGPDAYFYAYLGDADIERSPEILGEPISGIIYDINYRAVVIEDLFAIIKKANWKNLDIAFIDHPLQVLWDGNSDEKEIRGKEENIVIIE